MSWLTVEWDNRYGEGLAMSVGGAGPQVGFVVSLSNWMRDLLTGGRTKKLEDQQRQARQARIEEHHRRHPDAPESTPD